MCNTRWRFLSGSALKTLALITMVIDHLAHFYWKDAIWIHQSLLSVGHREITPYFLMRACGRIAFPLFAFLLVEGFIHTRNRFKYGRNLLIFALISEIPWNLVNSGIWHYTSQNVFFTLFLGYLGLCAIVRFKGDNKRLLCSLLGLLAASVLFRADYGCSGFGFILLLYVLRDNKILQAIIGSCVLSSRWIAGLAFIPINMYNGERGFVKGAVAKYFFYVFYPAHLLILYFLRFC